MQINQLSDRLKFKLDFSKEDDQPEIISVNSIDDQIRFEDKYVEMKVLGQGAHAVVKLAKKKKNETLYAVKITRMNNEEIYNNVKRTFLNARCLRHKNLIQEIELFINEKHSTACLVMEYCDYPSLLSVLNNGVLNENETRQIVKQLLLAVKHMHEKGICHRDIKPDNILVNINLEDCPLKLIDFGVSRRYLVKNYVNSMITKTGNLFYSAPEIYHQAQYSTEIDIWSIGIVMYQCLTGRLPLHNDYAEDFIELLANQEQWNFMCLLKDNSLSAQNLISRILVSDPKKRITLQEALQHPFIEKNQIYSTLALYSSKNMEELDKCFVNNKCKSLQASLQMNSSRCKWQRVLQTINVKDDYQDIIIEDLIYDLGNIHISGKQCSGLIQLINSLGNSQGIQLNKTNNLQCSLGIGSCESIISSDNPTSDQVGDLYNLSFPNTGKDILVQKSADPIFGGKIDCSIEVNVLPQEQSNLFSNSVNQLIKTLDSFNIKCCDEFID